MWYLYIGENFFGDKMLKIKLSLYFVWPYIPLPLLLPIGHLCNFFVHILSSTD